MSKFIEVKERRYGDTFWLNIDNIVCVYKNGNVLTNAVHGEQTGFFGFDEVELKKIIEAIEAKPAPKESV